MAGRQGRDGAGEGGSGGAGRGAFATTRWSVVVAAGLAPEARAEAAMEELCRTYWYPLYAHVRRRGHTREDAEDLTQAFFARLLEKGGLEGLSPERGRFRSFLLVAMKHFLANEWDRSRRLKRGGGVPVLSLDWQDAEARYQIEPTDRLSPDRLYDRSWAVTLLERVLAKLGEANAGSRTFEVLRPCLTASGGALPLAEVAGRLGISENAARVAAHRLRRQYRALLRAEIAETIADPGLIGDELEALMRAFGE